MIGTILTLLPKKHINPSDDTSINYKIYVLFPKLRVYKQTTVLISHSLIIPQSSPEQSTGD
jgi:hypothetical protein